MSDAAGAPGPREAAAAAAIEARAARAVPAAEAVEQNGWLLRATPGSSRKRASSALPLPGAAHELDAVAAFYRARGLRPIVQLAPLEALGALDAALAARGWQAVSPTDVLVADAAAVAVAVRPAAGVAVALDAAPAASPAPGAAVALDGAPTGAGVRARAAATLDGLPAGGGVAVADAGWSGLFAIETAPEARRRGVARTLVAALARWSAANGCDRLYLQVEADNAPAQALYRALGFTRSHGYHYRVAALT